MAASDCVHFQSCFDDWLVQQHKDLHELLNDSEADNEKLKLLTDKCIQHFEEYAEKRAQMAESDAPCFMSPTWCSSFENAFLWIGGCRPSLSVRLVYSVCGTELNDHLDDEFLINGGQDNLGQIDAHQLQMINTLHCKIIRDEDKLSSKMATLQEDVAEMPLKSGQVVGESSEQVERAIEAHNHALAGIVRDADKLRLATLKEVMGILTPRQGVDFLVSTKKLHLSMHEWGKKKKHRSLECKDNDNTCNSK